MKTHPENAMQTLDVRRDMPYTVGKLACWLRLRSKDGIRRPFKGLPRYVGFKVEDF